MQGAVSSEDCELPSKALDHAWEIFLKSQRLDRHNHDIAKPALVYGILDAAKDGLRHPRRLAVRAVASFDKFEALVRHQRAWVPRTISA